MAILPALRLRRDDAWVLTWRNCMLFLWQRVTVEALRAAHEVTRELRHDHPQGIVTVSCMMKGAPILPSKEARTESLHLMQELRGVVKASAAVFEGTGLVFATARVFISAILVTATRSDQKFKVFDTVERAAPWLAPTMQSNPTPQFTADLTEALVRGRAMHGRSTTSPQLAR